MAEEEHEQFADQLAQEADKLERHGNELGKKIDDLRTDWKAKRADPAVPGAIEPDSADDSQADDSDPPGDDDPSSDHHSSGDDDPSGAE